MSTIRHLWLAGAFTAEQRTQLESLPACRVQCVTDEAGTLALLAGATEADVLVLDMGAGWHTIPDKLAQLPPAVRPVLLAILPREDSPLLRQAMQAGARDYLVSPVSDTDLRAAVTHLLQETGLAQTRQKSGRLYAVISTHSDHEAAFLTANLAELMTRLGTFRVAVLDFDLQFGSLPLMLDMAPERSLLQALEVIDSLDEVAVEAYLSTHASGVRLMGARMDEIAVPGDVAADRVRRLLAILRPVYDYVFINLPKQIDPLNIQIMEDADRVLVCLRQSLGDLNYARGLLNVLRTEMEMPVTKFALVLNQYKKTSKIRVSDIEQTLRAGELTLLPFEEVLVNSLEPYGLLLSGEAPDSAVTQALSQWLARLAGVEVPRKKSLLARVFSRRGGE